MQAAITKLKTEMDKEKNPYVQVVGQYLINHIKINPQDAEKILTADKTILKSLEEMKKEASKKKVGNVAVLTDEEGFAVVLKYFGIDGKPTINTAVAPISSDAEPIQRKQSSTDFDVRLEDLL